jgi:broad specificity phosphatase PhoE
LKKISRITAVTAGHYRNVTIERRDGSFVNLIACLKVFVTVEGEKTLFSRVENLDSTRIPKKIRLVEQYYASLIGMTLVEARKRFPEMVKFEKIKDNFNRPGGKPGFRNMGKRWVKCSCGATARLNRQQWDELKEQRLITLTCDFCGEEGHVHVDKSLHVTQHLLREPGSRGVSVTKRRLQNTF